MATAAGQERAAPWLQEAWLRDEVAALAGRDFTPAPGTSFAAVREERLDVLADLVTAHLDTAALSRLIEGGPVPGLPALVTSLSHDR